MILTQGSARQPRFTLGYMLSTASRAPNPNPLQSQYSQLQ